MQDEPPFELPRPDLGLWRAGNTGTTGVWRFDSGVPGRDVLVTALVHGNELCGAWALLALLQHGVRPQRGALTLAFCNLAAFDTFEPDAHARSRCVDQDLNRLWGAMPWRADGARTQEQRRVLELLPFVERADWLLDLHSMQDAGPPLVLTGLHAKHIALAARMAAPALVVADAGHAEGTRLRDHGRWNDPADAEACALLVECGFHGELAARDVALDVTARFLVEAGTLAAGDVPDDWVQPQPREQRFLLVTEAVTAEAGEGATGFVQRWHTGQRIPLAGTLLGHNAGRPFVTPYDGCTLIMPTRRAPRPGATLVRLARDVSAP